MHDLAQGEGPGIRFRMITAGEFRTPARRAGAAAAKGRQNAGNSVEFRKTSKIFARVCAARCGYVRVCADSWKTRPSAKSATVDKLGARGTSIQGGDGESDGKSGRSALVRIRPRSSAFLWGGDMLPPSSKALWRTRMHGHHTLPSSGPFAFYRHLSAFTAFPRGLRKFKVQSSKLAEIIFTTTARAATVAGGYWMRGSLEYCTCASR